MFQQNETSSLLPYASAGLSSSTCLISMPKENAFAITGGQLISVVTLQDIWGSDICVENFNVGTIFGHAD